jgi:hypothetical protein
MYSNVVDRFDGSLVAKSVQSGAIYCNVVQSTAGGISNLRLEISEGEAGTKQADWEDGEQGVDKDCDEVKEKGGPQGAGAVTPSQDRHLLMILNI